MFSLGYVTADWLAVTVSLDRYNAVNHALWYQENCTAKRAWVVIVPIVGLLVVAVVPKALSHSLQASGECRTLDAWYSQILTLSGLIPIVLVVVFTAKIVARLQFKISNAADAKQKQVRKLKNRSSRTV